MKLMFSICMLMYMYIGQAQNVGINKPNPLHSLDINGTLNVDGGILTNGVAGSPGQVLATSATGSTEWANRGDFTRLSSFTQNGSFTVPPGITRIMIEAWGAGGGGSSGGGGSAGMHTVSLHTVVPGQLFTIVTGVGGANASTYPGAASDGTTTTISSASPSFLLTIAGGRGAAASTPGYSSRYGTSNGSYIQYTGQNGDANTVSYAQKNSTTFTIIRKYGDGGAAGPGYERRSQGQTQIVNENTGTAIEVNNPTFAPFPGGGGGGGTLGEDGAPGMVIIWY